MPETRAIAAEKPIESPIASATMVQVERRERSLVHSERSRAPKPGAELVVGRTVEVEKVVAVMGMVPFCPPTGG
jgi:hypothetical protein